MQDDKTADPAPFDSDAPPASHDQMNRPGMTNGVPDQAEAAEPKGRPSSDRQSTETGPGQDAGRGS